MAKAKSYKLQARESKSDDWFDCGDVRFPTQAEGDEAAAQIGKLTDGEDLFRCIECESEDEAESVGAAR